MGVLFQLAQRGDSGGHVALDALDLQTRHFLGLDAVVAAGPAPAVVAGCALETFHTAAGTWVLCPAYWRNVVDELNVEFGIVDRAELIAQGEALIDRGRQLLAKAAAR